jgi:hypothetical protein
MGKCAVCGVEVKWGNLLCWRDWAKVPKPMQQDVYLALRRYHNDDIDLAALREVQQAAIDYVREKP